MRLFYLMAIVLALNSVSFAGEPEVDTAEVIRRGDMVVVAGEGPRAAESEAFLTAMAPPADDAHKWYITIITTPGCVPCEKLKTDFQKAPELLAFVSAPQEDKAWAHLNIYSTDDGAQKWRLERYGAFAKGVTFPLLIVQPPRDKSWGEPAWIVMQKSGYAGDPKKKAAEIREAVRAYTGKLSSLGYPRLPIQSDKQTSLESSGDGFAQAGVAPPFSPAPAVPAQPTVQPFEWPPQPSPQPTPIVVQPAPAPSNPPGLGLLEKLMLAMGSVSAVLLVVLRILERVAPITPTKVDDIAVAVLTKILPLLQGGIPSVTPSPPTPLQQALGSLGGQTAAGTGR